MTKADYPHKCPFCASPAYINGMDQVECSNLFCVKYDGKGGIDAGITEPGLFPSNDEPPQIARNPFTGQSYPIGNPGYTAPNQDDYPDDPNPQDLYEFLRDELTKRLMIPKALLDPKS